MITLSSSGRASPGQRGRDGKRHKLQIVFGLLCAGDGCPVAVEVFEGNVGDPRRWPARSRSSSSASGSARRPGRRPRHDHRPRASRRCCGRPALDCITALRAPAIRHSAEAGALQLSLFDERDLAEISSPDYPGERLVVCRNPLSRRRTRPQAPDLLAATEQDLARRSGPRPRTSEAAARRSDKIGLAVGARARSVTRWPNTSTLTITDDAFSSPARSSGSTPKPRSTASMSCAPTSVREALDAARPSAPTKVSPRSSAPSVRLKTVDLEVRPDPSSPRRPRARPRAALHARLLSRMAHAPGTRTHSVR